MAQAPGRPSPFASMQGSAKDGQNINLQNLASMFSNSSTPLTAADLQKYQSAGLNMANFPSLPSVSCLAHDFSPSLQGMALAARNETQQTSQLKLSSAKKKSCRLALCRARN